MATTEVTSGVIKDASITAAKLAANSVDSASYVDGSIDAEHLSANSVDSASYVNGSIDAEHLADNAVTLAKMASGTDGNIISFDSSGNPVAIATGNDGQVLTSAGAGAPPVFETPAGGGIGEVIIGPTSFTGVRRLDIGAASGDNAWAAGFNYRVYGYNIDHTSSGTSEGVTRMLGLQLLTNGGYQTDNYGYRVQHHHGGADSSSSGQPSIRMTQSTPQAGTNNARTSVIIEFINPALSDTSHKRNCFWQSAYDRYNSTEISGSVGVGYHPATSTLPILGCAFVHLAANTTLETSSTFSGSYIVTRTACTT
tara:strand:+ start:7 stop:939 length:933 start_codon:yes stop_codon:yes gene_type:complete